MHFAEIFERGCVTLMSKTAEVEVHLRAMLGGRRDGGSSGLPLIVTCEWSYVQNAYYFERKLMNDPLLQPGTARVGLQLRPLTVRESPRFD